MKPVVPGLIVAVNDSGGSRLRSNSRSSATHVQPDVRSRLRQTWSPTSSDVVHDRLLAWVDVGAAQQPDHGINVRRDLDAYPM
jgi:hypothetical protein